MAILGSSPLQKGAVVPGVEAAETVSRLYRLASWHRVQASARHNITAANPAVLESPP